MYCYGWNEVTTLKEIKMIVSKERKVVIPEDSEESKVIIPEEISIYLKIKVTVSERNKLQFLRELKLQFMKLAGG